LNHTDTKFHREKQNVLPRLYAILDVGTVNRIAKGEDVLGSLLRLAAEWADAGVELIQYRNKQGTAQEMLRHARELKRIGPSVRWIMNDRVDLCLEARFDGVHLGQEDLAAESARRLLGSGAVVGLSTHNDEQVRQADGAPVDYIAIGPVFPTQSKENPDAVVGLEGVKRARGLTSKPLVAIGGITRKNFAEVLEAGANSVALISDLMEQNAAREFLRGKGSAVEI
jgi:thiamine-phosphate pyrophosphorylase